MSMRKARHQMLARAGRIKVGDGEAVASLISDEACPTRHEKVNAGQGLLAQVLARENMQRAWKRVKANQGAAGVDGMDIAQTGHYLVNEAILQVLQPLIDPTFSHHSHGFHPGRRARDALLEA